MDFYHKVVKTGGVDTGNSQTETERVKHAVKLSTLSKKGAAL